jgi:hypothetical protein
MDNVEHASEVPGEFYNQSVADYAAKVKAEEVEAYAPEVLDHTLSLRDTLSDTQYWRIFYPRSSEETSKLPPFMQRQTSKSPIRDNESDKFLLLGVNAISTPPSETTRQQGESPFFFQMRSQWEEAARLRSEIRASGPGEIARQEMLSKIEKMNSEITEMRHKKREKWARRNEILYKIKTGKAKREECLHELEEFKKRDDLLEFLIETREAKIKTMLSELEKEEK